MKTYLSTKEIAALVRAELKQKLPQWKFSVTYQSFAGGSSISLRLMAGPFQVIEGEVKHGQLNQYGFNGKGYQFSERELWEGKRRWNNGVTLTPIGWDVMKEATQIIDAHHWDESEPQIDYFCCNFYYDIAIGKWDKDFQVKGK